LPGLGLPVGMNAAIGVVMPAVPNAGDGTATGGAAGGEHQEALRMAGLGVPGGMPCG